MSQNSTRSATRRRFTSTNRTVGTPVMTQRQIMLVIVGLMAGMFLSALDQTIVGTAIRTIGDDLKGLDQQAWVTTGYLIASTITTPIYGKLSDLFGRRPLYIFGIAVFILGSLLSTFSTSMIELAAFRAVQGVGAGALMSLPLAIMGDMLAPRERAKYQGFFLAVFGVSSVIGPLVGGVFAGADEIFGVTGWRWVFLLNVPIGLIALAMVLAFLHLPTFGERKKPRIDWWGATAVIATLVPMLLVAEQGREWGWTSVPAVLCYTISIVGLLSFLLIERKMGDDAIIPLKLFRNETFSMATILGFLVGFAMFGAMLTIPLYLQIVTGLTPTESGFATLPMMAGMMIASIVSGQIVSRTGKYRIFPITGTASTSIGYIVLTFMTVDKPLWFMMIAMFFIGLGLGQLMQSLTLASQSAVDSKDMGVATSSSTFFRQIGGTMGTAVLLSVLFALMPTNILHATADEKNLTAALDAALNPTVATAEANAGVMDQIWTPIVGPVTEGVQKQLDATTAQISQQAAAGGATAVATALEQAADQAHATVVDNALTVNWADDAQRSYWVEQLVPTIIDQVNEQIDSDGGESGASTNDTSYLNGADPVLTRPFMEGFNASAITIYWIGLGGILLAFVLSWFFKVPPLRQRSALQEAADAQHTAADLEADAVEAANTMGSPLTPDTGNVPIQAGRR